jgi:hypothetical protein
MTPGGRDSPLWRKSHTFGALSYRTGALLDVVVLPAVSALEVEAAVHALQTLEAVETQITPKALLHGLSVRQADGTG